MARRKKAPRKFGVDGAHAEFNSGLILDLVARRATRNATSKYQALTDYLEGAGFDDRPAWQTWRQWENRRKIASAWLPTILYSVLVKGEKVGMKDLLKVHDE